MKKEIVTTQELFSISSGDKAEMEVLVTLSNLYLSNPEQRPDEHMELRKKVKAMAPAIASLHRKIEILKAAITLASTEIEYAANVVDMPDEFKWQAPRKSTTCTDMNGLFAIAQTEGVTSEYFMSKVKPITAKDAAEILGLSQEALLEKYGDIFETKESKPVLKRLY